MAPHTVAHAMKSSLRAMAATAAARFSTSTTATTAAVTATSPAIASAVSGKPRHFQSIGDLTSVELSYLVDKAAQYRQLIKTNSLSTEPDRLPLLGHTVAMLFSKRSTRTRVSSEVAINYLGGHPMFLGKEDIQLGVNETAYDTSRVISSMTSAIVARVGAHKDIEDLAAASSVPVINALSDMYHPLQAIADLLTIKQAFPTLRGVKVAWVGDANNVLNDLAMACVKLGVDVAVATPATHPVDAEVFEEIVRAATATSASVSIGNDPLLAVKEADVIVTDTWISMGQESEKQQRLRDFAGFQVSSAMAAAGGAKTEWKFMHCLPRKPEEVTDEVFYSARSLVFDEAENRLYAMLAALEGFVLKRGVLVE
ncbi:Aspartate/ornithine carbamoyltransferase [Limtongia smithiae]|uniref:Aspartate/ornithine carbamoyltransferase n=1 Tax=Limtongia smithiae TaxID=1125753 RepID=UPI0034CF2486